MKQTVLITGASSGIGKEYAYAYAAKGYDVILVARSLDKLQKIQHEIRHDYKVEAHVFGKDLSEEWAAEDVYRQIKSNGQEVDVLINNAGMGTTGRLHEQTKERNHQQVMLNVNAVVNLTQLVLQDMVQKNKGTIINVASMASFQPIPYMSIYAASKAFLLSFTEGLHEEYKDLGIHIMAVCPGNTQTSFFENAPDSIKVGNMRTSKQVVYTSMKGIKKGRSYVIDGTSNIITSLLPRFLPRGLVAKISKNLMKKSMFSS